MYLPGIHKPGTKRIGGFVYMPHATTNTITSENSCRRGTATGRGPSRIPQPRITRTRNRPGIMSGSGNAACASAIVIKDPHLNFAYGGKADFRGRHNALYNFLSTPSLSVNVKIEEAIFTLGPVSSASSSFSPRPCELAWARL